MDRACIGRLDWEGCDECGHNNPDTGVCKVWRGNIEDDGDFVYCLDFIAVEDLEIEQFEACIHPAQLKLVPDDSD